MYGLLAGIFELKDIESLFGPNWGYQKQELCNVIGNDSPYCDYFKSFEVGPIAGGDIHGHSEIGVQQM